MCPQIWKGLLPCTAHCCTKHVKPLQTSCLHVFDLSIQEQCLKYFVTFWNLQNCFTNNSGNRGSVSTRTSSWRSAHILCVAGTACHQKLLVWKDGFHRQNWKNFALETTQLSQKTWRYLELWYSVVATKVEIIRNHIMLAAQDC